MLCQYYNVKNVDELIYKHDKNCEDLILIIDDYTDEFFSALEKNHLKINTFLKDAYDTNVFVVINHYVKPTTEFGNQLELDEDIRSSIYFKNDDDKTSEIINAQGEFLFINKEQNINQKGLIDKY